MTLSEGQLLQGRYRIDHMVARGGYGAVYKAFDTTLNRTCAVKENLAFGAQAERQFVQEAQLLARLHHANLPRVIDHFLVPKQGQYLVMDYVEGRNLQELLRQRLRPFSQEEALGIVLQVCSALAYLHGQSPPIVHRDVKPQNIIMTPGGGVMLVDFGISKVVHGGPETLTRQHSVSPGFAPPEQYGLAPTDARADVYSVGATLYTLLTGQAPVDGLQRLTNQVPLPPVRRFNGGVSPGVEQIVAKAMEPSVNQRLGSIAQLEQGLAAERIRGSSGRTQRSRWGAVLAAVGLVLALLIIVGLVRTQFVAAPGTAAVAAPDAPAGAPVDAPTTTPASVAFAAAPTMPTAAPATPTAAPATELAAESPVPSATDTLTRQPTSTVAPSATASPTPMPTLTPQPTPTAAPAALPTPLGGGGRIIFDGDQGGSRDLYSMGPDGANLVDLTNDDADDWVGSLSPPDGRWLLFSSNRSGNWEIYLQDLDRGVLSRVTDDPAEDHDPAWSPDGERILFHSNRGGEGSGLEDEDAVWRLYSVAPNGDDLRVLTHDPNGSWAGAWSPDGRRIALSVNFPQPGEIYVMNADGSNLANLTNNQAHDSAAQWSPDGSRIAFYSDRDGNREVYVMNADGSSPQRLTDNPAADTLPAWSPDGKQIVFVSDRAGNTDLYRLDLTTGSLTQLTSDPRNEGGPTWAPY